MVTVAIALSNQSGRVRRHVIAPATMAKCAAGLVTMLAVAATTAWIDIFADHLLDRAVTTIGAIAVLLAIVGQVALAWAVALAARTAR